MRYGNDAIESCKGQLSEPRRKDTFAPCSAVRNLSVRSPRCDRGDSLVADVVEHEAKQEDDECVRDSRPDICCQKGQECDHEPDVVVGPGVEPCQAGSGFAARRNDKREAGADLNTFDDRNRDVVREPREQACGREE